jgi:hypothetical protein
MSKIKIVFIFLTYISYAQLESNIGKYYEHVNNAENFILKNDFNKAILSYNDAYRYKKEVFLIDIYNQAICYAILNKKNKCKKNLKILLSYGYPLDSLLTNEKFKKVIYNFKFNEKLLYDISYKKTIDSLFNRDQFFRLKAPINYRKKYSDSVKKIDSLNVVKLLQLIQKKGFPTERKTGVYPGFDYSSFSFIVVHNHIIGFNFSNIVLNAINIGELDNRIGAELHNLSVANGGDLYGSMSGGLIQFAHCNGRNIIKKTPFGIVKLKSKSIEEKNKNRMLIGLDDIETNQKKMLYNEKNKFFLLTKLRDKKTWCFENEDDYIINKEKLITIE